MGGGALRKGELDGEREGAQEPEMEAGEGVGVLIALKTLRAFCMFAFVMIERWLAPCLLLIHEL